MDDAILIAVSLSIFAIPVTFFVLAIRHFVPFTRGFSAPLWVYALGPLAFATDRYFSESARPHRKKFLLYIALFIAISLGMLFVFGKA